MTTSTITGTPVVAGLAYAPVAWVHRFERPTEDDTLIPSDQRDHEFDRYVAAANRVSANLTHRAQHTVGTAGDVLKAEATLATDPGLVAMVNKLIMKGTPAEHATIKATDTLCAMFDKAGGLMAERTTDLQDLCDRVVADLLDKPEPGIPQATSDIILFADDLAPADTAGLDATHVMALVTEQGGPTSHTSIISRQLGIPCIVAARGLSATFNDGDMVFVDASTGKVTCDVDDKKIREVVAADRQHRELVKNWQGPARLKSGEAVELLANVQDGAGARAAADGHAQGVGLFRTELCFLDAEREPTVDEQADIYGDVFQAFPHSKVVVRTLDAGSDKPVSWASLDDEDNPALGVRGIRTCGIDSDVLVHQLDAIGQAAKKYDGGKRWVMAPMVATISEASWVCDLIRKRGLTAGIMVEVPAVAVQIDTFMEVVDFVSIGTNDLTQYVMAADRMNPNVATYTDPWQPAVLTLINHVAQAGIGASVPVGVCGEAAADPLLACVLIGMGVTSLSMATSAIAGVGAQLEHVTLQQCRQAATAVLDASSPATARAAATAVLDH